MSPLEQRNRTSRAKRDLTLWLVYKVTDGTRNYVGVTKHSLEHRWQEHLQAAMRLTWTNQPLYAAIRELGKDAFHVSILAEALNEADAQRKEQRAIDEYNCLEPHGLNHNRQLYPLRNYREPPFLT